MVKYLQGKSLSIEIASAMVANSLMFLKHKQYIL